MFIEQSDQSRKCAPQLRAFVIDVFPWAILRGMFFADRGDPSELSLITGLVFRSSLYAEHDEWHCGSVNTLRELRRDASLSQRALAELLDVPVNTLRMGTAGSLRTRAHAAPSP